MKEKKHEKITSPKQTKKLSKPNTEIEISLKG